MSTGRKCQENTTIDVDSLPDTSIKENKWVCGLSKNDEEHLLSTTNWLNDSLVNVVQQLIGKLYPRANGLQNTLLGQSMAFDVMRGEFVQALHTGYGHWITISTYGCELGVIDIFDSTTPAVTSAIQQQIATILCLPTSIKEVTLRYFGLYF